MIDNVVWILAHAPGSGLIPTFPLLITPTPKDPGTPRRILEGFALILGRLASFRIFTCYILPAFAPSLLFSLDT